MNIDIWIALITSVLGPAIVIFIKWLFGDRLESKKRDMYAAKQSILQLIMEDKLAVMEGKLPENYQHVLDEFDDYQKAGGNHYLKEKVDSYIKWYKGLKVNNDDK